MPNTTAKANHHTHVYEARHHRAQQAVLQDAKAARSCLQPPLSPSRRVRVCAFHSVCGDSSHVRVL